MRNNNLSDYVLTDANLIHSYLLKKSDVERIENETFLQITILRDFKGFTSRITNDGLIISDENETFNFIKTNDKDFRYYLVDMEVR